MKIAAPSVEISPNQAVLPKSAQIFIILHFWLTHTHTHDQRADVYLQLIDEINNNSQVVLSD